MKSLDCECLVIGSGAGGAVAFSELAKSGKDVLLIEEGRQWESIEFKKPIFQLTQELYRNGGVFPVHGSPIIGYGEGVALGGTTVINGGLIWRTPEWILDEWESKYNIHGYASKDLQPHFEQIEHNLCVSTDDPIDGYDIDSSIIEEASNELGWKVVDVPRATIACMRANQCGSGCPSGSKQSVDKNYIKKGIQNGGRILTESRVTRLITDKNSVISVEAVNADKKEKLKITAKTIFLAAGPIQTPLLLQKSNIRCKAGDRVEFHCNMKVIACYPQRIHADKGTIFTKQIQEYERDGILIMGTNMKPPYLASSLTHLDNNSVNEVLNKIDSCAIYTPMIKPAGHASISMRFRQPTVKHYLDADIDLNLLKRALIKTVTLLFRSGVQFIVLPLQGTGLIYTYNNAVQIIKESTLENYNLLSVHAMSSCAMGTSENYVCDLEGRVRGVKNLYICDASILPTSTGESPQGTIMAFSHRVASQFLDKKL